jgi:hypothetical protein
MSMRLLLSSSLVIVTTGLLGAPGALDMPTEFDEQSAPSMLAESEVTCPCDETLASSPRTSPCVRRRSVSANWSRGPGGESRLRGAVTSRSGRNLFEIELLLMDPRPAQTGLEGTLWGEIRLPSHGEHAGRLVCSVDGEWYEGHGGRGVIEGFVRDRATCERPRELVGILEAAYDRNAPRQAERPDVLFDLDLTPLGSIVRRSLGDPSAPDAETGSPGRRMAHRGRRRPSFSR